MICVVDYSNWISAIVFQMLCGIVCAVSQDTSPCTRIALLPPVFIRVMLRERIIKRIVLCSRIVITVVDYSNWISAIVFQMLCGIVCAVPQDTSPCTRIALLPPVLIRVMLRERI